MKKKISKEERFLLKLYELASTKGDPQAEINRYEVGEAVFERPKGVDHIVQILTKNGLIRKSDERLVHLTDFGLKFIAQFH